MPGADHATIYNLAEDNVRRTYEKQEVSSKTSKNSGQYTKIKKRTPASTKSTADAKVEM